MDPSSIDRSRTSHFLVAFGTGMLLSLMVHLNGVLALHGGALFASWIAHGTGTVAAIVLLAVLSRRERPTVVASSNAPLWSYLGGIAGAATVVLTSLAVNSQVGLAGTLALGLVGQVLFGIAADRWGLFGLMTRKPTGRDLLALTLILAGSILILIARGAEV